MLNRDCPVLHIYEDAGLYEPIAAGDAHKPRARSRC